MKWKRGIVPCLITTVFVAAAADQPSTQIAGTNRTVAGATRMNSVRLLYEGPTNIVYQIQRPDGTFTNVVARGFVHTPTNMLLEWVRPDGILTNRVLGLVPLAPRRGPPEMLIRFETHQPGVGDYWLPGEFQNLLEKRKQERQQKAQ